MIGGLAAMVSAKPAFAAYGDPARVFGSKDVPDKQTIEGRGFKLDVPSNWVPSDLKEADNQVLRYEDSANISSSVVVLKEPTSKSSIDQAGDPDAYLRSISSLLGKSSFTRPTDAEGGFKSG